MSETAPPEHVPADQTAWVRLAEVNTRNAPLAIVSALGAQALGGEWDRRCDTAEPGNPDRDELMVNGTEQVQELTITYPWQGVEATDKAVLCRVQTHVHRLRQVRRRVRRRVHEPDRTPHPPVALRLRMPRRAGHRRGRRVRRSLHP